MFANLFHKHSTIIIIGIPLLLLVLSTSFLSTPNDIPQEIPARDLNLYLETLPDRYADLLDNLQENDSTFFCEVNEDFPIREIVVFKLFPDIIEAATDFVVEVYPFKSEIASAKASPFTYDIVNNAALYKYNGKTYGIYRKSLPLIDIEKLVIKRKVTSRKQLSWEHKIENPFNSLDRDFSFPQLKTKTNLTRPNPYTSIFKEVLKQNDISFLPSSYTIKNDSLFQGITTLNEYVTKSGNTIGTVERSNQFWDLVNNKDKALKEKISFVGENTEDANRLIENYLSNELEFEATFDIIKLASFQAIRNVFTNGCDNKMHFLYNEERNLIEPFFTASECLGQILKYARKSDIDHLGYIQAYIGELDKMTNIDFSEDLIKQDPSFKKELILLNSYYPEDIFDVDLIEINQRVIAKSLNVTSLVKTELIEIDKKQLSVSMQNFSSYPVDIKNLRYNKKDIITLNPAKQILSNSRDTVIIDLPRSFENLFVKKKNRATGFLLHKHIFGLNIGYSVSGTNSTFYSSIIPYQAKEEVEEDLFRIASTVETQEGITVNKKDKIVSLNKAEITISTPLIIPDGYQFRIVAGTTIDIVNGGKIISHGPLRFIGTEQDPIKIFSSDKKGEGMLVLSGGKPSVLEHVTFDQLTNPKHGYWSITGAVTFYESPVNLENVVIKNNSCEDALNIVRTSFTMKNCTISDTQSDAFDGDFVTGSVMSSKFDNAGNDAIDISGSDIRVENVNILNAGDKGLSAGEDSKMSINNVYIYDSEIGIAGKDLSIVNAKDLLIKNTKLGFTAFQKKPEFGPSDMRVTGLQMEGVETEYLIENSSSLYVDGVKIKTSQNVKDLMYGIEFGISSEETRYSQ